MKPIKRTRVPEVAGHARRSVPGAFLLLAVMLLASGCARYSAYNVGHTAILQAQQEIPEDQLLDVAIVPFASGTAEKQGKDEDARPDIRKAEGNYMAVHLKDTLQRSAQWGAVRVVPSPDNSMELQVRGRILESNGERLAVEIEATDATGRRWLKKIYAAEARDGSFSGNRPGEKDAFQDLYNAIANDLAQYRMQLAPDQVRNIRTVAQLKFARDFAPEAFRDYLAGGPDGRLSVNRLPAPDDTMMQRLMKIREREYMYLDTLNGYYDNFYARMWPSYENWRQLNREERIARRRVQREAVTRQLLGALMVAGAIAMGVSDVDNTGALQTGMIIVGTQVFVNGINISHEARIHSDAIRELGDTFGSEMQPVVMDLEGKQVELTGSAKEQFEKWKNLLREIYRAETGFVEETPPASTKP